jgi:uncharacterized damage-inducible protein DinB
MSNTSYVRRMAAYNQWMNSRLYAAAATLPAEALAADRKAFFGSIIGTLNHLATGDILWLKRFGAHPARYAALEPVAALPTPASLGALHTPDLAQLRALRERLDAAILAMADAVTEADLDHPVAWINSRGEASRKNFFEVLIHFFNHQTHHRGQVTTLLSQEGVDMGPTDLLLLIPNEED